MNAKELIYSWEAPYQLEKQAYAPSISATILGALAGGYGAREEDRTPVELLRDVGSGAASGFLGSVSGEALGDIAYRNNAALGPTHGAIVGGGYGAYTALQNARKTRALRQAQRELASLKELGPRALKKRLKDDL